jgi:hypothetical protein
MPELTIREAIERFNLSPAYDSMVRRAIRDGGLVARKSGSVWLLDEAVFAAWVNSKPGPGRPRAKDVGD